ncbi:MAG: orotate phosphoribosyltransferase [Omnitrophica WOR_2 bacterium RIFCSPHIGHO2_02_FULL_52_10]|nr:MAG: orotate phosphoribosyltransferase [Omnitrophica WOR_2 bacterium RIFCSPHIGHO2_02_FULL_52_10]
MTEIKQAGNSNQKSERTWAIFCHLSALVALIGVPFGNVLGPLVIWLIKKNDMPLVDEEGKSALNFQLSMTIYTLVVLVLCFVAVGLLFIVPIILANVILVIIASVKTSNGEKFQYPCTIQFIK